MLSNKQANAPNAPILPDPRRCRAAGLTTSFAQCLTEKPAACQYAIPFGYTFLCGSPERSTIVENTKQAQQQQLV